MFKRLKLFFEYQKVIKNLKFELQQKFNIRIDRAKRMYTVINVPEELIGEAFSLKKSDIDRISENYVRSFTQELGALLNNNGLQELHQVYEIQKVDKYSYLIVIGFRLFKSHTFYNRLYYIFTPLTILTAIILVSLLL